MADFVNCRLRVSGRFSIFVLKTELMIFLSQVKAEKYLWDGVNITPTQMRRPTLITLSDMMFKQFYFNDLFR